MQILYFNSFLKIFKKLPLQKQNEIRDSVSILISCLQAKTQIPSGIGLRKLRKDLWEIRIGIDLRIIFTIELDTLSLLFVGNHDEIRRYLKSF